MTPELFQKERGIIHKSLMKQKEIYDFSERIKPKEAQHESEMAAKALADGDASTKGADGRAGGGGALGRYTDLPPSLACRLCSNLIERATMTPCCFNSCCYECLKSYLTSSHRLASSRAGVCPISDCREQDIFVQDLIPNYALSKAADWFIRQKVSLMDEVPMEVSKDEKQITEHKKEAIMLGSELISEAIALSTAEEK